MCERCHTSGDWPANWPDRRTYSTKGWGIAAAIAVVIAVLAQVGGSLVIPLMGTSMVEDLETRDSAYFLFFLAQAIASLPQSIAGILVLVWLWRVVTNLDAFARSGGSVRPGWAVGSWFVPFANFVVPFRAVSQVVREEIAGRWGMFVVVGWWAAWLSTWLISCATAIGFFGHAPRPLGPTWSAPTAQHVDFFASRVLSGALYVTALAVAGILLIVLMLTISKAQTLRVGRARARQQAAAAA